jgi:AraC-like DNA-binding protein
MQTAASPPLVYPPRVRAWQAPVGLFERYRYEPAPAGRDEEHVHADVQLCLSLNFPGRYRMGRRTIDVPAASVSLVDAWEPHAAEDPMDRPMPAYYVVLYVSPDVWDAATGRPARVGAIVRRCRMATHAFAQLLDSVRSVSTQLEQQARLGALARALLPALEAGTSAAAANDPRLERAREFLHAHAAEPISLTTVARVADLSPQHFAASFRARYGVPPHRFQTLMRLDRARALLARGVPIVDVAAQCGFVDQSHLTRHFRRYLGLTPGRYRTQTPFVVVRDPQASNQSMPSLTRSNFKA